MAHGKVVVRSVPNEPLLSRDAEEEAGCRTTGPAGQQSNRSCAQPVCWTALDRESPRLPSRSLCEEVLQTTTYRLLLTLEEAGWLERDADSGFRLTIRLFEIGSILVDSLDLTRGDSS